MGDIQQLYFATAGDLSKQECDAKQKVEDSKEAALVEMEQLQHEATSAISKQEVGALLKVHEFKEAVTGELDQIQHEATTNVMQKVYEHKESAVREINRLTLDAANVLAKQRREMRTDIQEELNDIHKPVCSTSTHIKQQLVHIYQKHCTTLTVSPLFEYENEQLLQLYKLPTLYLTEYQRAPSNQKYIKVTSCRDIFCKKETLCRDIYIIGDAGVGKSSFCQFLCLLWYKSNSGNVVGNDEMQEYVDFIGKFDFVFYVTLRETDRIDVVAMIVDQLFFTQSMDEWNKLYSSIKAVLIQNDSLVILDGLDEWNPNICGKQEFHLPSRPFSEQCVYITTCRPYKTDHIQFNDRDHQVQITGITGKSSKDYIKDVVSYINKKNSEQRDPVKFHLEIIECGLGDLLCIPIIASHLIVVWFEQKLTKMPRSLIYGSIMDMLFEIAIKRNVEIPPCALSDLHLPDSLSKLNYLNDHVSLLQKVCLLSFRSLFNLDKCSLTLVFTRQRLMLEPYFLYPEQMDFLCKIGILSRNRIIGRFGKQEQKVTFLHLSYLEYFAALFVASFDENDMFNNRVAKNWTSLDTVLKFKNFFLFLAGFSMQTVCTLFDSIYPLISKDLTLIRRNSIFHYRPALYQNQLKSMQSIVISCIKESRRSGPLHDFIMLEDFYFDGHTDVTIMNPLLEFNQKCAKSIHSVNGQYFDVFSQIKDLHFLRLDDVSTGDYSKFTQLLLDNQLTLHTICMREGYDTNPLIPELPVSCLHHLTSLYLAFVKMEHNSLRGLVNFLSDNRLVENIKIESVYCNNHRPGDSECTSTLNLSRHTKLTSLCLWYVNIACDEINSSGLQYLTLRPLFERIDSCSTIYLTVLSIHYLNIFL